MSKGCAGIKILEKSTIWRNEYLSGTPVQTIATKYKTLAQVVNRAIWLLKFPEVIKLINIREAMKAEYQIKHALGHNYRILFAKSGSGKIKNFFKDNTLYRCN